MEKKKNKRNTVVGRDRINGYRPPMTTKNLRKIIYRKKYGGERTTENLSIQTVK